MLELIIKKMHKKVAFSLYGILGLITMLLPLVLLGFGIYFVVTGNNMGYVWMVVALITLLISIRKLKDFLGVYKYVNKPKKFPMYKALEDEGIDISSFDEELTNADPINKLSKKNPFLVTENFVFGFSQVSFFVLYKKDVLWAYEYNGNGLVLFDKNKIYGFTFFPTVDGNDLAIEELKKDMPYIYYGTDFDYQKVMHDEFNQTVENLIIERDEFLADPAKYREKLAQIEAEKLKAEEEKLEQQQKELENKDEVQEETEPQLELNEVAVEEDSQDNNQEENN